MSECEEFDKLAEQIDCHLRQLAPHQRARETAKWLERGSMALTALASKQAGIDLHKAQWELECETSAGLRKIKQQFWEQLELAHKEIDELRAEKAAADGQEPCGYIVDGEFVQALPPPPYVHGGTKVIVCYTCQPITSGREKELIEENANLNEFNEDYKRTILRLEQQLALAADSNHFTAHQDVWESVSGEPENFLEDESNTATIEDGWVARQALALNQESSEAHRREIEAKCLEEAADKLQGVVGYNPVCADGYSYETGEELRYMATEKRKGE